MRESDAANAPTDCKDGAVPQIHPQEKRSIAATLLNLVSRTLSPVSVSGRQNRSGAKLQASSSSSSLASTALPQSSPTLESNSSSSGSVASTRSGSELASRRELKHSSSFPSLPLRVDTSVQVRADRTTQPLRPSTPVSPLSPIRPSSPKSPSSRLRIGVSSPVAPPSRRSLKRLSTFPSLSVEVKVEDKATGALTENASSTSRRQSAEASAADRATKTLSQSTPSSPQNHGTHSPKLDLKNSSSNSPKRHGAHSPKPDFDSCGSSPKRHGAHSPKLDFRSSINSPKRHGAHSPKPDFNITSPPHRHTTYSQKANVTNSIEHPFPALNAEVGLEKPQEQSLGDVASALTNDRRSHVHARKESACHPLPLLENVGPEKNFPRQLSPLSPLSPEKPFTRQLSLDLEKPMLRQVSPLEAQPSRDPLSPTPSSALRSQKRHSTFPALSPESSALDRPAARQRARVIRVCTRIEDHYYLKAQVMQSVHPGMEIRHAQSVKDENRKGVVIKVREKACSFQTQADELAWRDGSEFILNLPSCIGIARVIDVLEDLRAYYVVMEKVNGLDLYETLSEEGPMSPDEVKNVLRQLLRGLSEIHSRGYVHNDLKLENVMCEHPRRMTRSSTCSFAGAPGSSGSLAPCSGGSGSNPTSPLPRRGRGTQRTVKLIDFDTVKEFSSKSPKQREVVGTDQYIAPEAYLGICSPASDMFSIGVIGYKLLTGRFPFDERLFHASAKTNTVGSKLLEDLAERMRVVEIDWSLSAFQEDPGARLLLQRLLAGSHARRPSAQEAFLDPWLQR